MASLDKLMRTRTDAGRDAWKTLLRLGLSSKYPEVRAASDIALGDLARAGDALQEVDNIFDRCQAVDPDVGDEGGEVDERQQDLPGLGPAEPAPGPRCKDCVNTGEPIVLEDGKQALKCAGARGGFVDTDETPHGAECGSFKDGSFANDQVCGKCSTPTKNRTGLLHCDFTGSDVTATTPATKCERFTAGAPRVIDDDDSHVCGKCGNSSRDGDEGDFLCLKRGEDVSGDNTAQDEECAYWIPRPAGDAPQDTGQTCEDCSSMRHNGDACLCLEKSNMNVLPSLSACPSFTPQNPEKEPAAAEKEPSPLDIECPTCCAEIGAICRSAIGNPTKKPHKPREKAWAAQGA